MIKNDKLSPIEVLSSLVNIVNFNQNIHSPKQQLSVTWG